MGVSRTKIPKRDENETVPFWRYDEDSRITWSDYTKWCMELDKKGMIDGRARKDYWWAQGTINFIMQTKPKDFIKWDLAKNELSTEWLKGIIEDTMMLIRDSPSYDFEQTAIKVLCYVIKVFQLTAAKKLSEATIKDKTIPKPAPEKKQFDSSFSDKIFEASVGDNIFDPSFENKIQPRLSVDSKQYLIIWKYWDLNSGFDVDSSPLRWLYDILYKELGLKLNKRGRWFPREFFRQLMHKNPFLVWKLLFEANKCEQYWRRPKSRTELCLLISAATHKLELVHQNQFVRGMEKGSEENRKLMKRIFKDMTTSMIPPLNEYFFKKRMQPTEKLIIGRCVQKVKQLLGRFGVDKDLRVVMKEMTIHYHGHKRYVKRGQVKMYRQIKEHKKKRKAKEAALNNQSNANKKMKF